MRKSYYLRLDRPQQLGSIASSLKRIGTNIQFKDEPGYQAALATIEECHYNLQTDDSELSLAKMLLQVGRQVSQRKHEWQHYCKSSGQREEVSSRP
jgi:hypothetical protein